VSRTPWIAAIALSAPGCWAGGVESGVIEAERLVTSTAVVPAPSAPLTGPLVPASELAFEGEVGRTVIGEPRLRRDEGADGTIELGSFASARLAFALRYVEFGFREEAAWSPKPAAVDVAAAGGPVARSWWSFRIGAPVAERWTVPMTFELGYARIPAETRVAIVTWNGEPTSDARVWDEPAGTAFLRTGVELVHRTDAGLGVAAGVGLQTLPTVAGSSRDTRTCYWRDEDPSINEEAACRESIRGAEHPFGNEDLVTPWVTAFYDVAPVTVLAQAYAVGGAGPSLPNHPVGFRLAVRVHGSVKASTP
jgi:hypothetical protein